MTLVVKVIGEGGFVHAEVGTVELALPLITTLYEIEKLSVAMAVYSDGRIVDCLAWFAEEEERLDWEELLRLRYGDAIEA